jgi:hypothetical protein
MFRVDERLLKITKINVRFDLKIKNDIPSADKNRMFDHKRKASVLDLN